jgi:hypothetical protein
MISVASWYYSPNTSTKMKQLYIVAAGLILISCNPKLVYVGNSYNPSQQVEIFVDEAAIKKNFIVIGVATPEFTGSLTLKNYDAVIARKAVEIARKKGADAVYFQNYYRSPEGGGTKRESTTIYSDTAVRNQTTVSRTIPRSATGRQILLLKYVD